MDAAMALALRSIKLNDASIDILDQQLARARAGQSSATAVLIRAHQKSVYSIALRMLGARELAEDLTQEVFMQMSGHLKRIDSNQHLLFWLRKVTTNKAIDQLRHRARIEWAPLEENDAIADSTEHRDPLLQRRLSALLQNLAPDARAVVLLRYQEDLDPTDIARTLDMPINTVKSHLKRSLDSLRESLEEVSS
jgi:RNA polymerase sigma-70 factor (ECF subfamily)